MWLNLHHSLTLTNLMGEMWVPELVEDAGVKSALAVTTHTPDSWGRFHPTLEFRLLRGRFLCSSFLWSLSLSGHLPCCI